MKHFRIDEWVDLARGTLAGAERNEMRRHLAEGCGDCCDLADFSASLADLCESMTRHAPPEHVVRSGKAVFPAHSPVQPKRTTRIAVQLVYDSFLVPAPAGLRATWQASWQALYHAGDCSLDLRIEPELASTRVAVIGQINNHVAPADRMEDIPVYLKAGRTVVAETRSNRFGEFQIEYDQQSRLQLWVYVSGGSKHFQVPLKKFGLERGVFTERLRLGTDLSNPEQKRT